MLLLKVRSCLTTVSLRSAAAASVAKAGGAGKEARPRRLRLARAAEARPPGKVAVATVRPRWDSRQ
jgi:hypothetical protein